MNINDKFYIYCKRDTKKIYSNICGYDRIIDPSDFEYSTYESILKIMRSRKLSIDSKNRRLELKYHRAFNMTDAEIEDRLIKETAKSVINNFDGDITAAQAIIKIKQDACKRLQDFFTEFNFTPSMRFVNTLALVKDPKKYAANYFILQDNEYAQEISEKIKSAEFTNIMHDLKSGNAPSNKINSRLKLYYGEPGTGKTTQAVSEADKCIVCASDMLPTDLMQNFAFSDGKAEFQKSDLWIAMENGETIVLDEINMLPFESLRFLQGITDGKPKVDYKGFKINIKDGFQIIGTMNLNINSTIMGIPAPLVDRCSDIIEFTLTPELLVQALM